MASVPLLKDVLKENVLMLVFWKPVELTLSVNQLTTKESVAVQLATKETQESNAMVRLFSRCTS